MFNFFTKPKEENNEKNIESSFNNKPRNKNEPIIFQKFF